MTTVKHEPNNRAPQAHSQQSLPEVTIGILIGMSHEGTPLVVFAENEDAVGLPARAVVALGANDIGCEVAMLFEGGDSKKPLIIGRVQQPKRRSEVLQPVRALDVDLTEQHMTFHAEKEIVFKCGKSSITLTRAGKIILRGTYILSRSSGANCIKGGSIQLN